MPGVQQDKAEEAGVREDKTVRAREAVAKCSDRFTTPAGETPERRFDGSALSQVREFPAAAEPRIRNYC
jgi:hypothetical protein